MRNDDKELIGINKNKSSKINLIFEDKGIETITFFNQVKAIFSRNRTP
jgi:hypothetical protein